MTPITHSSSWWCRDPVKEGAALMNTETKENSTISLPGTQTIFVSFKTRKEQDVSNHQEKQGTHAPNSQVTYVENWATVRQATMVAIRVPMT